MSSSSPRTHAQTHTTPLAIPSSDADDITTSVAKVDDRLEHLAHSISNDVLPGIERELSKVKGWLAMLDAREKEPTTIQAQDSINNTSMPLPMTKTHTPTHTQLEAKLKAQQKLQTLITAVEVFKTALGPLHKPVKSKSFSF